LPSAYGAENGLAQLKWHYSKSESGIFGPTKIEVSGTRPNGQFNRTTNIIFSEQGLPREQFFLSYYDLPEPPSAKGLRWNWIWTTVVVSILLFIGLGVVVRRRGANK